MKGHLSCGWKHLKWRHYTTKRRLFNARRRLFSAKRRLFKVLHPWPRALTPYTNNPYTHIHPCFHPWPTPQSQYSWTLSPILPNRFGSIRKCCQYDSIANSQYSTRRWSTRIGNWYWILATLEIGNIPRRPYGNSTSTVKNRNDGSPPSGTSLQPSDNSAFPFTFNLGINEFPAPLNMIYQNALYCKYYAISSWSINPLTIRTASSHVSATDRSPLCST